MLRTHFETHLAPSAPSAPSAKSAPAPAQLRSSVARLEVSAQSKRIRSLEGDLKTAEGRASRFQSSGAVRSRLSVPVSGSGLWLSCPVKSRFRDKTHTSKYSHYVQDVPVKSSRPGRWHQRYKIYSWSALLLSFVSCLLLSCLLFIALFLFLFLFLLVFFSLSLFLSFCLSLSFFLFVFLFLFFSLSKMGPGYLFFFFFFFFFCFF